MKVIIPEHVVITCGKHGNATVKDLTKSKKNFKGINGELDILHQEPNNFGTWVIFSKGANYYKFSKEQFKKLEEFIYEK